MNKKKMHGFTLIELMIVIAILGILIAIALPAYRDYSIRTRNAECLNVIASAKVAVTETFHDNGVLAANAAEAGYAPVATDECAAATIVNGVISVVTTTDGPVTFRLEPTRINQNALDWDCNGIGNPAHMPAECRP
jgi:type IV pilus assembly protein PilA